MDFRSSEIQFFQITSQCILPGWKRSEAIGCQFALIQTAVERTSSLAQTILLRGHRQDFRLITSLTVDFFREFVPADVAALVSGMIIAVLLGFIHINKQLSLIHISEPTRLLSISNAVLC